jgi:hypothetical protein
MQRACADQARRVNCSCLCIALIPARLATNRLRRLLTRVTLALALTAQQVRAVSNIIPQGSGGAISGIIPQGFGGAMFGTIPQGNGGATTGTIPQGNGGAVNYQIEKLTQAMLDDALILGEMDA